MSDWLSAGGESPYCNTCQTAARSDSLFERFKRIKTFFYIVGTDSHEHGYAMFNRVKQSPIFTNINTFLKNDQLAKPLITGKYGGITIGLDTLRFVETTALIEKYVGSLSGLTVAEFGSCYGGLAFCLLSQWPDIKEYYMIDLPEVEELSKVYLTKHGIDSPAITTMQWADVNNTKVPIYNTSRKPADLFISELALTEMTNAKMIEEWVLYGREAKFVHLRINIVEKNRAEAFINTIKETHTVLFQEEETKDRRPNQILIAKKI